MDESPSSIRAVWYPDDADRELTGANFGVLGSGGGYVIVRDASETLQRSG